MGFQNLKILNVKKKTTFSAASSLELKQNSKDIKDKIDKLKASKLHKDNYILSKEDKESFIDFINNVDSKIKNMIKYKLYLLF